ncbi:Late embryogenesis abundant (LEA) hydroxyproline-rich glycoprotein family [Raphanus sativus]|uniref:NDR1/HIN1-like protein 6 n=1 Tax=Raphanus sativus TaxID=3726 RepID=A0A6J0M850_RAPSA|nr:NDR1/HIN1-like protein 6 [Raphanus sativus]KAJ4909924.1 Late embryogenesis abundant (LEA) hydroxyproline-rich glycoprotein family [Raphanus sativus]
MSNHPKVHPLHDPEARSARPSAPLVSGAYPRSEQGDPAKYPLAPPRKRGRSCCCRCVCCTLCLLFLLVVAVGATIGALYLVYKPKLPDYSIDRLQLTLFALNQDSSLSTAFNVTITAKNSNEKIGIYYEDGSEITVWYKEAKLSQGSLPKFYQGHENSTVIYVEMSGQAKNATGIMTTLQEQQQTTGNIPLRINVNQPVRIKFGMLKLMEVRFLVRCDVFVDSLAANNVIKIQSSSCKFRPRL